jgi:hypothetical protein
MKPSGLNVVANKPLGCFRFSVALGWRFPADGLSEIFAGIRAVDTVEAINRTKGSPAVTASQKRLRIMDLPASVRA